MDGIWLTNIGVGTKLYFITSIIKKLYFFIDNTFIVI
jgi:hypothetical protein